VRSSSITSLKQDKKRADQTFKVLFDKKSGKTLSEFGRSICDQLAINPDALVQRRIEAFESKVGDKEMAKLHYDHYMKRRQKLLLRINDKLISPSPDRAYTQKSSMARINIVNSKSAMGNYSPPASQKKLPLASFSSASLRRLEDTYERQQVERYERISNIYEKRKQKEKDAIAAIKDQLEEKLSPAKKFNERQLDITAKMNAKNRGIDRKAFSYWKKDVKEAEDRQKQRF
jgi:hypothetical protein